MTQAVPPVAGYLDRLSRRPGERFTGHVSLREPAPCRVRILRVVSGDPNPAGPGLDLRPVPGLPELQFDGTHQPVPIGSHAVIRGGPRLTATEPRCWSALVWMRGEQAAATVLATEGGGMALALQAGTAGAEAEVTLGAATCRLATGVALAPGRWHRLWLSHDPSTGRVLLGQSGLAEGASTAEAALPAGPMPATDGILVAARGLEAPRDHFTGKIEAPMVAAAFVAASRAARRNSPSPGWTGGRMLPRTTSNQSRASVSRSRLPRTASQNASSAPAGSCPLTASKGRPCRWRRLSASSCCTSNRAGEREMAVSAKPGTSSAGMPGAGSVEVPRAAR